MSDTTKLKNWISSQAKSRITNFLENEPIIQSDWKYTEINDSLQSSGHLDSKGRQQGRWKLWSEHNFWIKDYVDGKMIFQNRSDKAGNNRFASISDGNKETRIYFESTGELQSFYEYLIKTKTKIWIAHGWFINTECDQNIRFYCNDKLFVSFLHDNDDTLKKIRIIQRHIRRKAFVRRYLLFTQLKFMPLDVLSIINRQIML